MNISDQEKRECREDRRIMNISDMVVIGEFMAGETNNNQQVGCTTLVGRMHNFCRSDAELLQVGCGHIYQNDKVLAVYVGNQGWLRHLLCGSNLQKSATSLRKLCNRHVQQVGCTIFFVHPAFKSCASDLQKLFIRPPKVVHQMIRSTKVVHPTF